MPKRFPDRSKGTMYQLKTMTIGVFEQLKLLVVYAESTSYLRHLSEAQVIILKYLLQHYPESASLQQVVEALGQTYVGPTQASYLKHALSRLRDKLQPELDIFTLTSQHATTGYLLVESDIHYAKKGHA